MLISPHQTASLVIISSTMKRSFGDLPVNSPVSIAKAPVLVKTPSPRTSVSSINCAGSKFQYAAATLLKPNVEIEAFTAFLPYSFIKFVFEL